MEKQIIIDQLKELIEGQDEIKIDSSKQELDIDSYTMMLVISYVREEMEVQLDMDVLDFDAFTSLDTLSDVVIQQAGN